jgi:NADP-dependent 3-hydroxy acid dehydrogenase YdfG
MSSFEGKVAVITGAGSGIGRALAVDLAVRGAKLALSDIDADGLAETVRAVEVFGKEVKADRLNVAEREEVLAYADDVVAHFGTVHQVYNNAGIAHNGNVEESDFKDIERIMDVDFWGVVNGTKAFLPHVIASGDGHIVNISSLFGLIAVPGQSAYNAAKFAVRGFTEALRQEMLVAGHRVKVTCVHPGGIKTAVARNATADVRGVLRQLPGAAFAGDGRGDDRRRCPRWPCARGDRLGGQSPRRAVAAHGVGVSAGHGHRGSAVLPLGQQALTVSFVLTTAG